MAKKGESGYYVSTRRKCESAVSIFKSIANRGVDRKTVYDAATKTVSILVDAYVDDKITHILFMELLDETQYYYDLYIRKANAFQYI